jgi:hypothetical protein
MNLARKINAVPALLRFLALHGAVGVATGIAVGAALLATDAAGIGTLVAQSGMPFVVGLLYFSGFAATFGGAMMGTAVMLLSE